MKVILHKTFVKHFDKRIKPNKNLLRQFQSRYKRFVADSSDHLLKDHQLRGVKKDYRAFSITGDIRVIYKKDNDSLIFYDIGTHNQVY